MLERALVTICIAAAITLFDVAAFGRLEPRAKAVYAAIMLLAAYAGLDYALYAHWPNFYDVTGMLLAKPAQAIVNMIKVPQ